MTDLFPSAATEDGPVSGGGRLPPALLHMPDDNATHRDWTQFARRMGEVLTRFYELDVQPDVAIEGEIKALQQRTDSQLRNWVATHHGDLPSLPVAKGPGMELQHQASNDQLVMLRGMV